MNSLRRSLDGIVRLIAFRWGRSLLTLLRLLFCQKPPPLPLSERDRNRSPYPCVPINRPEMRRPDPLIYSQYFLMKQGLAVTWDNPDIVLKKASIVIPSSSLEAGTTYEIVARIWNASTSCPVISLPVSFSFLSFGVGTTTTSIGKTYVDLGVKGGSGCPAYASMQWTTPTKPGHYCIQVQLAPADDLNFDNNLGQENTNVIHAQSPASFDMQVRNATEVEQDFTFVVDRYEIPKPNPCEATGDGRIVATPVDGEIGGTPNREEPGLVEFKQMAFRPRPTVNTARTRRHTYGSYPLPPEWRVEFSPSAPRLDPGEEITVHAVVYMPDDFHGAQPVNVDAFMGRNLAGGVTVTVVRS